MAITFPLPNFAYAATTLSFIVATAAAFEFNCIALTSLT